MGLKTNFKKIYQPSCKFDCNFGWKQMISLLPSKYYIYMLKYRTKHAQFQFGVPFPISRAYSPEKWLHNRIYCPSNRSKQIKETYTACSAGTQYMRQSLNEKQHTRLHRQRVIGYEAMYVVFHSNFALNTVCWRYKPCEFPGFVWTDCWGNTRGGGGGVLSTKVYPGTCRWNGSQNQPPGITMTPYSVQKLV